MTSEVSTQSGPTQISPTFSRDDLGAAVSECNNNSKDSWNQIHARLAKISSICRSDISSLEDYWSLVNWKKQATMTANEKFIESCKTADIDLLKEAITEGADLNQMNDWGETYFEDMIYEWGSAWDCYYNDHDEQYKPDWTEEHMIEFAEVLADAGFNLNAFHEDEHECWDVFWSVAKWGNSLPLLEALLKKGMNPNHMDHRDSMLEALHGDIFAEECSGYPETATYLYNACRLAIAYGALPGKLITKDYEPGEEEDIAAALQLDASHFRKYQRDVLIQSIHPDWLMVRYGRYGFPKEYYFESEVFQRRLVTSLDEIIAVIGIENLDDNVLEECVDEQYVLVLEHLIGLGANPNVNCFNKHYSYVVSSALFTLKRDGHHYDKGNAERMKEILQSAGAR